MFTQINNMEVKKRMQTSWEKWNQTQGEKTGEANKVIYIEE